jgi:hypothetical protein
VKIAFHACVDKGINDLPTTLIPTNIQHLQHIQHGEPHPAGTAELTPISPTFVDTPFLNKTDKTVPFTWHVAGWQASGGQGKSVGG